MRWYVLASLLLLTGCATARLYDGEPVDKSNASFISNAYLKARIRPVGTDGTVETAITDDGIWVSKGSFIVRYACLQPSQSWDEVPGYPHEKTIRIEAGYHYQVNCFTNEGQIGDDMHLVNIGWEDVWYHTSSEASYEVAEHVRGPGETPREGSGFRYEFYNDWGFKPDVQFNIDDGGNGRLAAQLDLYRGPIPGLAAKAYDEGVHTWDGMLKAVAPTTYVADSKACPKVDEYLARLRGLFMARLNKPKSGPPAIYTDSPHVYRYYMGNGADAMAALYVIEDQDELYKTTQEAMDYTKTCGTKQVEQGK